MILYSQQNVQDIINFTEIMDNDDGSHFDKKFSTPENKQNSISVKKNNSKEKEEGYLETPQLSGMEEDLKIGNKNSLIIDKLKERNEKNPLNIKISNLSIKSSENDNTDSEQNYNENQKNKD